MSDYEPHREMSPGELTMRINEILQNTSPEILATWIENLLTQKDNNLSIAKGLKELLEEQDTEAKFMIEVMAVIHSSSFKTLCLRYSREGKFGTHEPGIHEMGNIMAQYRQLIQDYNPNYTL